MKRLRLIAPAVAILALAAWLAFDRAPPPPDADAAPAPPDAGVKSPEGPTTAARLSGRVTSDGRPVADAQLSLLVVSQGASQVWTLEVKSGSDGRFEVEAPEARVRVLAEHPDHALGESREVFARKGERYDALDVDLTSRATVIVEVRDGKGAAVRGAAVVPLGSTHWQLSTRETDESGNTRFEKVPVGEIRFRASAPGLATTDTELLTLAKDETRTVEIVLAPLSGIEGFVVTPSGARIPGARVSIRGSESQLEEFSDESGSFRFEGLPKGPYELVARHPAYSPSTPVTAWSARSDGRANELVKLELLAGGSIRGTVVDANGKPVPDFVVGVDAFEGPEGKSGGGFVRPKNVHGAADGAFELTPLGPGTYSLYAESHTALAQGVGRLSGIVVTGGAATEGVVLRLASGGIVRGIVLDKSNGAPIAGARIALSDAAQMSRLLVPRSTSSDREGRFSLDAIASGRRGILVSAKGFVARHLPAMNVSDGSSAEIVVQLEPNPAGKPPQVEFFGIGAVLAMEDDGSMAVREVVAGGAGERAGLAEGTKILRVDGESVEELGLAKSVELIRGEEGTSVVLEVIPPGESYPVQITLDRGRVVYDQPRRVH